MGGVVFDVVGGGDVIVVSSFIPTLVILGKRDMIVIISKQKSAFSTNMKG